MRKSKILILEDDPQLGSLLVDFLASDQLDNAWVQNGLEGLEVVDSDVFDLALVDVMMPTMDGFTFARKLRERGNNMPLLFCTARSLKHDKLQGFSLGADDYIVKPFDEDELLCRIHAILRRSHTSHRTDKKIQLGKYLFDPNMHQLVEGSNRIRLTKKENRILQLLCRKQGEVVRREDALVEVYGKNDYFLGRSFDVFISKLRKALRGDPSIQIENIFGVGFMLKVQESREKAESSISN